MTLFIGWKEPIEYGNQGSMACDDNCIVAIDVQIKTISNLTIIHGRSSKTDLALCVWCFRWDNTHREKDTIRFQLM